MRRHAATSCCSIQQVLLRWGLQQGMSTIPKSVHADRIKSNMDIFDWSLPAEDMAVLSSLPVQVGAALGPAYWRGPGTWCLTSSF